MRTSHSFVALAATILFLSFVPSGSTQSSSPPNTLASSVPTGRVDETSSKREFVELPTLYSDASAYELSHATTYGTLMEAVDALSLPENEKMAATLGLDNMSRVLGNEWNQEAQVLAPVRQPLDLVGFSVAISGDTAVIGSRGDDVSGRTDQGSAYVFVRSGTSWSLQAHMTAADGSSNDRFAQSVAISGDSIVIGAPGDDVGSNTDQGSAYVYTRMGTAWAQQAHLTAADGAATDEFGQSVSISGDTVIVGSRQDVGPNLFQGAAYIFTRSGASWSQQAHLTAADGSQGDNFGNSVAISGDTVVIGAFVDDVGPNSEQGSAYLFTRSGTAWTQQTHLIASDGANSDRFGRSVSISGDTVVIGADTDDIGANADQGSAYVFTGTGGVWSQQGHLTAVDGSVVDGFGYSVSIDANTVVVGSYADDVGTNSDQGSAYVFTRTGGSWIQLEQLTTGGRAADLFGHSVALSGDKIVVGAPFYDAPSFDEGAAYIFDGPLAPTAAGVSISGRIETPRSVGLKGAVVRMTDSKGTERTAISSAFGFYRFHDVPVGDTYFLEVHSKRFTYAPRVFLLLDELSGVDFRPEP